MTQENMSPVSFDKALEVMEMKFNYIERLMSFQRAEYSGRAML